MSAAAKRLRRHVPVLAGVLVVALIVGGLFYLVRGLMAQAPGPTTKKVVQQISIIQPPPPPPPPPEQKPPPEQEKQKVDIPKPEKMPKQMPDQAKAPPPGDQLGLDAAGGAGGDSFGLVGRQGGRSLVGGGSQFAWYAGQVQQGITDLLAANDQVRTGHYSVVIKVWLDAHGRVRKVVLIGSSGDRKVDRALEAALDGARLAKEAPPDGMPQPIRLRVSSRG